MVHGAGSLLGLVPVELGEAFALHDEFAGLSDRRFIAVGIDHAQSIARYRTAGGAGLDVTRKILRIDVQSLA